MKIQPQFAISSPVVLRVKSLGVSSPLARPSATEFLLRWRESQRVVRVRRARPGFARPVLVRAGGRA